MLKFCKHKIKWKLTINQRRGCVRDYELTKYLWAIWSIDFPIAAENAHKVIVELTTETRRTEIGARAYNSRFYAHIIRISFSHFFSFVVSSSFPMRLIWVRIFCIPLFFCILSHPLNSRVIFDIRLPSFTVFIVLRRYWCVVGAH